MDGHLFHIRQSVWNKLKVTFESDTSSDAAKITEEKSSPHNDGMGMTGIVLVKIDRQLSEAQRQLMNKKALCGSISSDFSDDPHWHISREADFFVRAAKRRGLSVRDATRMALTHGRR